jgi:hypothetical protein
MSRRRPCTATEARARLHKARDFLDLAEVGADRDKFDPATSNAVLAGIAAADAICCRRIGQRSASEDHAAATQLLAQVDGEGAQRLARLLSLKYKAQYDHRPITPAEAQRALRWAGQLVELAERILLIS